MFLNSTPNSIELYCLFRPTDSPAHTPVQRRQRSFPSSGISYSAFFRKERIENSAAAPQTRLSSRSLTFGWSVCEEACENCSRHCHSNHRFPKFFILTWRGREEVEVLGYAGPRGQGAVCLPSGIVLLLCVSQVAHFRLYRVSLVSLPPPISPSVIFIPLA